MTLSPGTRLGPYEIVALIGAGGMGEVYRAADTRLSRHVALKVIAPEWSSNRQARLRFEREARAISALSHPHVCTLHDIGEQGDVEFLVMEFVEGETLAARLVRGPLSIDEFVRYGSEIADALETAHGHGITHRDLKPGNIMITPRGSVKILDFGLAKLEDVIASYVGQSTDALTRPGVTIGTFQYMSPEQASGGAIGPGSDVFSLGVVLYEGITGREPFQGSTQSELIRAIVGTEPVRPSAIRVELPGAVDKLLGHMLAKEPSARPSPTDVREALKTVTETVVPRRTRPLRHVVGREKERAEILDRLGSERGSVISVAGEAGLGKTTLVDECLTEFAERSNARIAAGRCSERLAGSEAYLPILEALADFVKNDAGLARSLKLLAPAWYRQVAPVWESAPDAVAPPGTAGQERLKRELTAFFEEATQRRPIILFLDDIHWADASTVDLIGYLAAHLGGLRFFIIMTARQSELLLRKHPFLQLTRELQPRGTLHQILLHFLNWDEVQKYMQLEFPENRFDDAFRRLIYDKTEGSPLFMVDLLRYLRDREVIALRDGAWQLTREVSEIEEDIPASVRSMIDRKIDQLSEQERTILIAASVQGGEFDSAVVAKALETDAGDIEEILARLDRVHELVRAIGEQEHPDNTPTLRYRFVHALYQNSLYASLGPARKTSLSAKVANALLNVSAANVAPVASQLALLFKTARDFGQATEFFLAAAQHAGRLFANQEAVLLARRGLDCAKRVTDARQREQKKARLHELLGDVFALIGQHSDAHAAYAESLRSLDPGDALARAGVYRKSANVFTVQRLYPEAAAAFDSAQQQVESMDAVSGERWREWIEIQLDRGWMFYWQGDLAALAGLTKRIEREVETRATPEQRAKFFHTRTMAGFRRDRYAVSDETLALAKMALAAEQEAGHRTDMGKFMLGFSHMWRNELDLAEPLLQQSLKGAERSGDIVLVSRCLTYLTVVARKRRDDATVRHFAERSLAVTTATGMVEYVTVAKANLAWLAWRQHDFEEVLRLGHEAVGLGGGLALAGPNRNWWAVCFPMMDTLLQLGRTIDAIQLAEVLIQPQQHLLSDALQTALRQSVQHWSEDRRDEARQELRRACELAQEGLFL